MRERLGSWLPLLPLLLLLGATYWLNLQVQSPEIAGGKKLRHDPDYLIENFIATTLDEKGEIRFVMSAKKMLHYPDDDTTHLEYPRLESLSADQPPVRMSALNGEILHKDDEIFLRNNVVIVRPAHANRSELTFTTDLLQVLPNKNIVRSDQPISMVDARTRLNAVGMEMDNKARTIKFLSQVNSVYVPVKK